MKVRYTSYQLSITCWSFITTPTVNSGIMEHSPVDHSRYWQYKYSLAFRSFKGESDLVCGPIRGPQTKLFSEITLRKVWKHWILSHKQFAQSKILKLYSKCHEEEVKHTAQIHKEIHTAQSLKFNIILIPHQLSHSVTAHLRNNRLY